MSNQLKNNPTHLWCFTGPCSPSRESAFTLLEILIAVAIMATSFLALLSAQGSSFLSSERAGRVTSANLLARQKIVELETQFSKDLAKNKFPDQDLEERGEFDEPYKDFRWHYTIRKVEIPMADSGGSGEQSALVGSYISQVVDQMSKLIREVQLTVSWGDKDVPEDKQPHMMVTTHWVKLK